MRRFKVADLARQGPLADHANKRARHLVESWVVRGDGNGGETEAEGATVATRDTDSRGGNIEGEERGHPQSLGLLLALCGLNADAKDLLGGFEAPASWPLLPLSPPPPSTSGTASDVATSVTGAEEGRREADLWSEQPGGEQQGEGGSAAPEDSESASSVPLAAGAEVTAAGNATSFAAAATAAVTAAAAGTPPAAYSLLDFEEATKGEAKGSDSGGGELSRAAEQRQEQGRQEQHQPPRATPAAATAAYFDDEADFLEKSASEYAELMVDQGDEEEYLSGFSFAPPPDFGFADAEAPPPPRAMEAAAGAAERMSEADRFRQLQQQQRARLAERQQVALDEAAKAADVPRPPPQTSGVVPSGGTAAGAGSSASGASPPRREDGAEPGIIRRANLLEGGQTIVLIDVETTGLGPKNDRVIQLAGKVRSSSVSFCAVYLRGAGWLTQASRTNERGL